MLFHLMLWWLLFCEGVTWVWKDKSTGNKMYLPDWEQNAIQVIWAVSVLLLVQVKRKAWESTKKPDLMLVSKLKFHSCHSNAGFVSVHLHWFMVPRGFFSNGLKFFRFPANFCKLQCYFSVQSHLVTDTQKSQTPIQAALTFHSGFAGDFILISQILWFQRLRRFRVVSLHSVGSSENPQGA